MKILAIGNSFSQDASTYVKAIALAQETPLTIVNLYIGGCSLETHWHNAETNESAYAYELDGVYTGQTISIKEALDSDDWDIITLQQVSDRSGLPDTFYPYIEFLSKYVKSIKPRAELVIHQTWAYETGYERLNIYGSQKQMFDALRNSYNTAATQVGKLVLDNGVEVSPGQRPLRIIPSGQAMQNARALPLFDDTKETSIKLCRDGFHASLEYGRYLLGAVWYEALTGENVENNSFRPEGMDVESWKVLKRCAHDAITEYGWR